MVAALGNDLPDTNKIEQEAIGFMSIPNPIEEDTQISFDFTLSAKSIVSLGFAADIPGNGQMYFHRIELLKEF